MKNSRAARGAAVVTSMPAALLLAGAVHATDRLDEVVVTASRMHAPLMVTTDPKAPRQPLPAHDAPCMFAASGTAAPLPVPADVLAHVAPVALRDAARVAPAPLLAPRRTQSPRAPPSKI